MTHCELGGGQGNIFFVKMIYNVVGLKEGRISFFCVFLFPQEKSNRQKYGGMKEMRFSFFSFEQCQQ